MKTSTKTFNLLMLLAVFLLLEVSYSVAVEPEHSGQESHLLDGRTYIGQNGSKGMPADHPDEFIFADGQFRSLSCDPYGFGTGDYRTTVADGIISFDAITKSPSHGQIAWHGTVTGDTLDATFVWTKERWYWNTRQEYWFKGTLKP